jgi:subtilisin family serine protease
LNLFPELTLYFYYQLFFYYQVAKQLGIEYIERNRDVREYIDYSAKQVGVDPYVWQFGYTGTGITVAVLDSGVDENHPDLKGKVKAKRDFTRTGIGDDDVRDTTGHGTHVASIIAGSGAASEGRFKGIAPDARLLIARVLSQGTGTIDDIILAVTWAINNGTDIINMSLGTEVPNNGKD